MYLYVGNGWGSCVHSLVFALLSDYCVSGSIPHTMDTAVNKTDEPSALIECH